MRIVSLLPSATEIVFELGLGDSLVGVTDECDFPEEATTLPVVSRSQLPPGLREPSQIDSTVSGLSEEGRPLYAVDAALIQQLAPDVILTQDLCKVCAVPAGDVQAALDKIGSEAEVVSLDPHSLEEVFESIEVAGTTLGAGDLARELVQGLRDRVEAVRTVAQRLPSSRVLALEWSDPPWVAGHWTPQMIEIAGGVNLISTAKEPSVRTTWREIADATPEIVAFMPCGYYIEEAEEEAERLFAQPEFASTSAAREKGVFAFDATSFFSRPGPRLIEGLEALAWAIHPESFPEPQPGTVTRVER